MDAVEDAKVVEEDNLMEEEEEADQEDPHTPIQRKGRNRLRTISLFRQCQAGKRL